MVSRCYGQSDGKVHLHLLNTKIISSDGTLIVFHLLKTKISKIGEDFI